MLIRFSVAFFLTILPVCLMAQGFRDNVWGASKAQVIKKEGKPDIDSGDEIIFKHKRVAGYVDVSTFFYFHPKSHFVYGHYLFIDTDKEALRQIERGLTLKYGKVKLGKDRDGYRMLHWPTKETYVLIQQDDLGFLLNFYSRPYWNQLVKESRRYIQKGL